MRKLCSEQMCTLQNVNKSQHLFFEKKKKKKTSEQKFAHGCVMTVIKHCTSEFKMHFGKEELQSILLKSVVFSRVN